MQLFGGDVRFPLVSVVAACVAVPLCGADARGQTVTIVHGIVSNINGVKLPGVEVTVQNTALRVVTNDSGEYRIDGVPAGRVRVFARRLGFKPLDKGVKLAEGEARQLDFDLEGIPDMLDSVKIFGRPSSSRMADFYNRRAMGLGAFVTRDEIDRRHPSKPTDMLRMLAGVRVGTADQFDRPSVTMGRQPLQAQSFTRNQSSASVCRVNYYVDGNWMPTGTFHIDDLSPSAIEGIEVYRGPAETPARFRQRETACGLIVIWTREPPPKEGM